MEHSMRINIAFPVIVLVFLGCTFGCNRNIILLSPEDRFQLGDYYIEKGKFAKASEQFERIRTDYPTSQNATICQFKLAQSLFARKHYDEAAVDFEIFLEFHPAHELAPYAQYHLALCKYHSMLKPERDSTIAREALKEFDKFIVLYPGDSEIEKVRKYRDEVHDHLLTHDLEIGKTYYRMKAYDSAIDRINPVLELAHDNKLKQESGYYCARCYAFKKEFETAKKLNKAVIDVDPLSEWAKKSQKLLDKMK
jgi:outer membrane protein assembly factor BamD